MPPCPFCGSSSTHRKGFANNHQRFECNNCHRRFRETTATVTDMIEPVEGSGELVDATKPKPTYPRGWEPGVNMDGHNGTITSPATTAPVDMTLPQWAGLLERFGLDPKVYRVVEPVRMKSWEGMTSWRRGNETVTMFAYQATVVSNTAEPDLEALYVDVRNVRPFNFPPFTYAGTPSTLVVNLCDWQVGKGEGDGIEGTLARIIALKDLVPNRAAKLRLSGYEVDELVVAGVGDLVENCTGFYAMQEHSTTLDRRNQAKLVRRALRDLLMYWAGAFVKIKVTAVGGNHGENRKDGKAFTSFNDNDDVAVFEQVADILSVNPQVYGHVEFTLPSSRLAVALEVRGKVIAWTHGHVAKGGTGGDALWRWWKDQAHGRWYEGVADADVLVAGHFHHFEARETLDRLMLLCPTIDGGSEWYGSMRGQRSAPGTLTFVVTEDGVSGIEILGRTTPHEGRMEMAA